MTYLVILYDLIFASLHPAGELRVSQPFPPRIAVGLGQLKAIRAGTMAGGTSLIGSGAAAAAPATGSATAARSPGGPYNMVFILTDPERYFRPGELPKDYVLPAHERIARAADTSRP
jgi:hypothetical protein